VTGNEAGCASDENLGHVCLSLILRD